MTIFLDYGCAMTWEQWPAIDLAGKVIVEMALQRLRDKGISTP